VKNTKPILNVDDHAPARYVRTRILEAAGFWVEEVDNAAEAIERGPAAALLLLDVKLPDGDGFTVCERIKKISPDVPIIIVTSVYRTAQARRDAFALGADAFLLEPIVGDQLVRTVESLLHAQEKRTAPLRDAWIRTDSEGGIETLSDDAARLLNLPAHAARGRSLLEFFGEVRTELVSDLARATEGLIIERMNTLEPHNSGPVRVHVDLSAQPPATGQRVQLHWVITPQTR
jgi:CheY-like chemotaxis protein